jgi:hypothetical protein
MKIFFIFASCLLSGCVATTSVVGSAAGEKPITLSGLSCTNPYLLEQDCSNFSGATRKVMVGNRRVAVAGSKDGTIVLLMDADTGFSEFIRPLLLSNPTHDTAVNENYRVVRAYFDSKSVSVKRVRPVQSARSIDGYILELGSDGYGLLKELSVP